MYDPREENYVAAVACKEPDGVFRVSVYLLGAPLLDAAEGHVVKRIGHLGWGLLLCFCLGLAGIWAWRRFRRGKAAQIKAYAIKNGIPGDPLFNWVRSLD